MATAVTIDLSIVPARVTEFLAFIKEIAPDTRAYAGCQLFDIWADQDKPGRVLFYELWDSRNHQEKYLAWRNGLDGQGRTVPDGSADNQLL